MSPTIFRYGPFRFFFFSREETRMHVHVESSDGEAKSWLEPEVSLARSAGLHGAALNRIERLIIEREGLLKNAWNQHFGR